MNKELFNQAKEAKTIEELLKMAEENGIKMTKDQAEELFAKLNPAQGELSDDELDNVAGGGCGEEAGPTPKFAIGDLVRSSAYTTCSDCRRAAGWPVDFPVATGKIEWIEFPTDINNYEYIYHMRCVDCGGIEANAAEYLELV